MDIDNQYCNNKIVVINVYHMITSMIVIVMWMIIIDNPIVHMDDMPFMMSV